MWPHTQLASAEGAWPALAPHSHKDGGYEDLSSPPTLMGPEVPGHPAPCPSVLVPTPLALGSSCRHCPR